MELLIANEHKAQSVGTLLLSVHQYNNCSNVWLSFDLGFAEACKKVQEF